MTMYDSACRCCPLRQACLQQGLVPTRLPVWGAAYMASWVELWVLRPVVVLILGQFGQVLVQVDISDIVCNQPWPTCLELPH